MKSSKSDTDKLKLPTRPGALAMSAADRVALRSRAHGLKPVVLLGQAGLTEAVLLEVERALRAHELVKVKATGVVRTDRPALLDQLAERLNAAAVQQIGTMLVLYRPK